MSDIPLQEAESHQSAENESILLKATTIPQLLSKQVAAFGDQTFILVPRDGVYESISFKAFADRVGVLKAALQDQGITQGCRIAFLSHNRIEFLEAAMAVWALGATVVSLNPNASSDHIEAMLEDSQSTAVIVSEGSPLDTIRKINRDISQSRATLVLDDITLRDGERYLNATNGVTGTTDDADILSSDIALILFTSGTTKKPKGVPLTHHNILFNREAMRRAWKNEWTADDRVLGFLPYFHVMGLPVEFLGSLYVGGQYAFLAPPSESNSPVSVRIVEGVHASRATHLTTVPSILEDIMARAQEDPSFLEPLKRLKFIQSGGAYLSRDVGAFFHSQGINVIQGYGMTEVGGALLLGKPHLRDWEALYPLPGIKPVFVEAEGFAGKQLVLDHCPTVIASYLNNAEADRQAFPGGPDSGRFYTGDLFTRRNGGYVFEGRNDYVYKHSKGEKTNPLPIEQVISSSEYIRRVALIGDRRPHNVAIIQPNYNALAGLQWMDIEARIWNVVEAANEGKIDGCGELDAHSKILRDSIHIVRPNEQSLPIDRKGALNRQIICERFSTEIEQMYKRKKNRKEIGISRLKEARETKAKTDDFRDLVKRTDQLDLFLAYVEDRRAAIRDGADVNGEHLNISRLVAVGKDYAKVNLPKNGNVQEGVEAAVAHLRDLLDSGAHLYGISTGFGGSADTATRHFDAVQAELIRHLNAGFEDPLREDAARGAMLIRANSTSKGASGLRWDIIERVVLLLNKGITPLMPKRGSVTASGDLMPLSFLAALLMGKDAAKAHYKGQVISAKEALEIAGLEPVSFGPKEALALVNGTSVANALAAIVLFDVNVLLVLSQAATALSVEAILGTNQSFDPFIQQMKPHRSQIEVAKNILGLLEGSSLARDEITANEEVEIGKLKQDRYHQRTAPQWIGPQIDVVMQANEAITTEMNSVTDNPLVDVTRGPVVHGGNYQGTSVAVPMDHVRLSLQALGKIVFEQYQELVNKFYSNGLPPNLAGSEDMNLDMGLKGADTLMAGFMAELSMLGNPATNHVQPAELRNQSINSMGLMSARYTAKGVKILQMMMASYLYAVLQAIDLRHIERCYGVATETAIEEAVVETLHEVVENADEVHPAMIKHLVGIAKQIKPFAYALEAHTSYPSLTCRLSEGILAVLRGMLDGAEPTPKLKSDPLLVLNYSTNFVSVLAGKLRVALPKAKEQALQHGAEHLLGRTRPLYTFVRKELGVPFEQGDQEAGPLTQRIFDAIEDERIIDPLLDAFFPAQAV